MTEIRLPQPALKGAVSVEEAMAARRSSRRFADAPLPAADAGQILWACAGRTAAWGGRTAPSAGATYPLEVFAAVGAVEGIPAGLYRYDGERHALLLAREGDVRRALSAAAMHQRAVASAPMTVVIAAAVERTAAKYGERGLRYVHMEAGHAGQNIHLAAAARGLATVMIGAFDDTLVKEALGVRSDVCYLCPVGRP